MENTRFYLDNLWRWKCGLSEFNEPKPERIDLEGLRKSEWSHMFEGLMRNRLVMGALRYGKLHAKDKPQYDRVKSMIKRLNKYNESGNMELLVDVANLCLLEFEECNHPNKHFYSIDDGEHVSLINNKPCKHE